jgi:uncharacterized protein
MHLSLFPTLSEALQLLKDANCASHVIRHCRAVATVAVRIAREISKQGYDVDVDLVQAGALLHDIGRGVTHSIEHGIAGVIIAQSFGLAPSLIRIIERHIGSGITSNEARRLGLPIKDYLPKSLEEKIVTYADKLIEGAREVGYETAFHKFQQELGGFLGSAAIERFQQLHAELAQLRGST